MTDIAADMKAQKAMNFEDVLEEVGSYGRYQQRLVYFFLVPISLTIPFLFMNLITVLSVPSHYCDHPSVTGDVNLTDIEKIALIRPWTNDSKSQPSSCKMFDLDYAFVTNDSLRLGMNITEYAKKYNSTWSVQPCQYGWQYDQRLYRRTVASQWNLVCDDDYLPSLVFTMFTAGSAIGTPIFGTLSDKIGRKITFFISSLVAVTTAIATVTVPTFIAFIVVKGINGTLLPSVFQLPYLILVEIVSPEMRTRMNGIANINWTVGLALMPLAAWLTADWVWFGWICAIISVPYLIYFWFLPESPRWLISQDRYEDASKILENMARVNGKDIKHLDLVATFKKFNAQEKLDKKLSQVSPLELFRNPTIRLRFFLISMSWINDAMTYYGLQMNVSTLYGNEFVNFFLLALVEFPSYLVAWYLMETRLGRRWSNVIFLYLTAFACILPVTSDVPMLTTVASLLGKCGVSASFMVMYQQSAEIFPTPLRASGMAMAGTIAAIVTICTPYIIYLGVYGRHIPFTCMSISSLLGGTAALFVPETLNEILPQSVQDGENFGKNKTFFSFANTKVPVSKVDVKLQNL